MAAIYMRGFRVMAPTTSTARTPLCREGLLHDDARGFLGLGGRGQLCKHLYACTAPSGRRDSSCSYWALWLNFRVQQPLSIDPSSTYQSKLLSSHTLFTYPYIYVFMCMFLCIVCLHVCESACTHAYTCIWKSKDSLRCCTSRTLSTLF